MKQKPVNSLDIHDLAGLEKNPGKWFEENVSRLRQNRKVQAGFASTGDGRKIFIKRYLLPWFWDRLALWLYSDKAGTQFRISSLLIEAGINVPSPLAIYRDLAGSPPSVLYMCEALNSCHSLRSAIHDLKETDSQEIPSLMAHVAEMIARMHAMGVVHGDFKWGNILIAPGPGFDIWFVDLDNACPMDFPGKNRYALDLARFAVDMATYLPDPKIFAAFIHCYADNTGLNAADIIRAMVPFFKRRCRKNLQKKHKITSPAWLSTLAAEVIDKESLKIK